MVANLSVLILLIATNHLIAVSCSSGNYAVLESLECSCVAPICGNSTCQMTKLDEIRSNVTVGGMVAQKLRFAKFRVRRRTRSPSMQQWSKADMDFTIDYCDYANGENNPVINLLAPGIRYVLGDALRPCLLQGWFLVNYITDPDKKFTIGRPMGQLIKTEAMLVTINSQVFFKITLVSKVL